MELRVLRYFLAVAREENITRAAALLHVTQPTLSRQLMQLEEELGVKLFRRGQYRVVLTDEGMLLRRRAQEILELAEKAAETVLVNSIQHINRCIVMEKDTEEDGNHTLQTEGVNFPVVWMYQHLVDVNKVYSNDIWKILETYGVEAARTAIITEIERVFDVYSISIDPRHLSLIADYMTQDGSYRPMNRGGLENVESPFQQMSFETTTHFLNNAVLYGNSDGMKTPSACIATGKVMKAGTGSFQIVQPLTVWRVCSTTRGIHVRMKALFEALKNPWVSVSAAVLAAYIYPVFFAIAGVFRNCQFFGRSGVRSVSRGVFHAAHVESDGQWQTTPRVGVGQ